MRTGFTGHTSTQRPRFRVLDLDLSEAAWIKSWKCWRTWSLAAPRVYGEIIYSVQAAVCVFIFRKMKKHMWNLRDPPETRNTFQSKTENIQPVNFIIFVFAYLFTLT